MAVFPSLELEDKLQIQDKTRFNVSKSFVSSGAADLTVLTVQPGDDQAAIDLVSQPTDNRYLDWQFNTWNGDFDANNNKIDFVEDGTNKLATITPGLYTLATLATEIQLQLNASGINTYTVAVSNDDKLTISVLADESFSLLPYSGDNVNSTALQIMGFLSEHIDDRDFENKTELQGDRVRYLPKYITVTAENGTDSLSIKKEMKLYSVEGDALFSNDQDLISKKSDLLKWTKLGRNSFLDFHRAAQEEILDWFRGKGFINVYADPLQIKNFVKPEDINQWSVFLTLRLIFDDLSNATDDIFYFEARQFEAREMRLRDRYMRVDLDNDGKADDGEGINNVSIRAIRR